MLADAGSRVSLVGLELSSAVLAPALPSPPINSLPPRLCPIGLDGVVGMVVGESGGVPVVSLAGAAGLKEKSGSAETDFCRVPGVEPRRPAGYACSDRGRAVGAVLESVVDMPGAF